MPKDTRNENGAKPPDTLTAPASTSPPSSSSSGPPSKTSTERWKQPRTVRELSQQINAVSTSVLNDDLNLDKARSYSGMVRTLAQTVNAEVAKARHLRRAPDLSLDDGEDDQ